MARDPPRSVDRGRVRIRLVVKRVVQIAAVIAAVLAMDSLRLFGGVAILGAWIELETHYFYALMGVLVATAFLTFPTRKTDPPARPHDVILAVAALALCGYFFVQSEAILDEGWEFGAPAVAQWMSYALWLVLLEAVRRAAGLALFSIVVAFSVYPIFAEVMPGPISGLAATPAETAAYHLMSIESVLGVPFRAFANLVVGFLVFGVALQKTGGGRFFIDLANALLGRVRGGPAKVAIFASGLMGSMSGSVITNVLTTGQLTIPAMRRAGFRPNYAAGVEACASTGGVLLPPIMGSTAFVMATMLEMAYYEIALAAAVPALLYFAGLFIQVDFFAASEELPGTEDDGVRVLDVLRDGWFYIGAFVVLVFLLVYLQREAVAPFYATGLLLVLNQFSKTHRWQLEDVGEFLEATGRLLAEILVILAGVGFIVGALSVTGLSGTLVNDLLYLAGGNTFVLLAMGAVTSFVLGIGMTVTAAYIFLAIVLAPALVQGGLDPVGVHLFILYWAMLSFITPPVALGAFAAASIANAPPVQTGFTAMRLGSVIYFVPFIFVLNPAFLGAGSVFEIVGVIVAAMAGITLIAAGLQGYLPFRGRIPVALASLLVLVGFAMAISTAWL